MACGASCAHYTCTRLSHVRPIYAMLFAVELHVLYNLESFGWEGKTLHRNVNRKAIAHHCYFKILQFCLNKHSVCFVFFGSVLQLSTMLVMLARIHTWTVGTLSEDRRSTTTSEERERERREREREREWNQKSINKAQVDMWWLFSSHSIAHSRSQRASRLKCSSSLINWKFDDISHGVVCM